MVIQGQFINKASERQTLVNKPIPTAVYSLFPFCFDKLNELNEVRLLFLRIAALQRVLKRIYKKNQKPAMPIGRSSRYSNSTKRYF